MAYQPVDIGAAPNDGTGDPIRDAFDKVNDNFVEVYAATTGLLDFKGSTDCSANPNYPAASKGDYYLVSVAGKIGGASGIVVTAGDTYFALADNAGGTQAGVGTSWTVIQGNVAYVPVNQAGDTMTGDLIVPDEAYDATAWNGSLEVPTKNAVRDKIESLAGGVTTLDGLTDVNAPTPSNNDVLTWDSTPGEWVSAAPSGGSFTAASTTEVLTGTDSSKGATPDSLAALWEQGADVSSSGTTSLGEGGFFHITGTTTITDIDFATDKAGRTAWVEFTGALTLTHNASTLILPTGANITTVAGDTACFISEGSDVVRCVAYNRKSGAALVGGSDPAFLPPAAASFSLASGDATNLTLTDDSSFGLFIDPGAVASGQQFRFAYRTLSDKTQDWALIAKITGFRSNTNFSGFGVMALDTTDTDDNYSFGIHNDGLLVLKNGDLTTVSSTAFSVALSATDSDIFLRMRKTGGNIEFAVGLSPNGPFGPAVFSETDTTWCSGRANRVGIYQYIDRATGVRPLAICSYFSLTGPGV